MDDGIGPSTFLVCEIMDLTVFDFAVVNWAPCSHDGAFSVAGGDFLPGNGLNLNAVSTWILGVTLVEVREGSCGFVAVTVPGL